MNKTFLLLTFLLFVVAFSMSPKANAGVAEEGAAINQSSYAQQLESQGYTCYANWLRSYGICFFCNPKEDDYQAICYKTATGYSGQVLSPLSILGYTTTVNYNATWQFSYNSPFIYIRNAPTGKSSVTLTSALDRYLPEPAFNQKNGWIVDVKAGQVFLDNKKQDMLFYELAVNKITLNRNGRNFNSKEEVISFLQNSDFLNKLSFSEVEKKNSLNYFIPKINESSDKNFYYLTVLNESAIDEISQLKIDPKPERINMKYFAIYPTPVPVASTGEFIFPSIVSTDTKNYTVDVTGEFLVDSSMTVLWKN